MRRYGGGGGGEINIHLKKTPPYGLFRSTAHMSTSIKGMKNWGGWGCHHVQGISGRFILPKLKILLCVSCSGGRSWILCEVNRDKRMLSFTCRLILKCLLLSLDLKKERSPD